MKEKLVRDYIPRRIVAEKGYCNFRVARSCDEHLRMVFEKLDEEVLELKVAKTSAAVLEEAADVYEVLCVLCELLGFTLEHLCEVKEAKHRHKGGFGAGLILEIEE